MSVKNPLTVIVYAEFGLLPLGTAEGLQALGHQVYNCFDPSELSEILKKVDHFVLLTDLSKDTADNSVHLKSLLSFPEVQQHPLVVIGEEMEGYREVLSKKFNLVVTIELPCTVYDIQNAIEYAQKRFKIPKEKRKVEFKEEKKEEPTELAPFHLPPLLSQLILQAVSLSVPESLTLKKINRFFSLTLLETENLLPTSSTLKEK
ncbi:MAG: hypothetical protein D6780_01910, partial [Candidatus Dadabacteria bacterium]